MGLFSLVGQQARAPTRTRDSKSCNMYQHHPYIAYKITPDKQKRREFLPKTSYKNSNLQALEWLICTELVMLNYYGSKFGKTLKNLVKSFSNNLKTTSDWIFVLSKKDAWIKPFCLQYCYHITYFTTIAVLCHKLALLASLMTIDLRLHSRGTLRSPHPTLSTYMYIQPYLPTCI